MRGILDAGNFVMTRPENRLFTLYAQRLLMKSQFLSFQSRREVIRGIISR